MSLRRGRRTVPRVFAPSGFRLGAVAGTCGIVWVGAAGAATTQATARPTPARSHVWIGFSISREHDDNVIQMTDSSKVVFGQEVAGLRRRRGRFSIGQIGDMLTTAEASLRWRARPVARRETRLQLDAGMHRYDHDRPVDWQQYRLSLTRDLVTSRRQSLTLDAFAERIPRYYLGQLTDRLASVAAGRSANNPIREALTFEQTSTGVRLQEALLRKRLEFTGGFERVHREYNAHFPERTNDNRQWHLQAEVTPFRGWDASARVSWLKGALEARGDIPDALGIVQYDISYKHDGVGVGLMLPWGGAGARGRLEASFTPEVRTYQTSDKFDLTRFGRVNHRRDAHLRATQRIWGPIDAIMTWERLTSRATFHPDISFPPQQTNFSQEQFGFLLRARREFSLR